MEQTETIGSKILALRKSKRFTQADIGVYLNISAQAVSKWERGESCPDFETLSKLAQLFNVPISYFEKNGELALANASTSAVATGITVQDVSESVESEEYEEEEVEQKMIGVCKDCGNVVYEDTVGVRYPTLICKECQTRRKKLAEAKAAEQKRAEEKRKAELEMQEKMRKARALRARNKGLIWGGIIATILALIGLSVGIEGVLGGAFTFFFISQLFWDGAVVDCALAGGKRIGTPGVIFELSLDGLLFLIGVKILFAILRFLVMIFTSIVCVLAAYVIAPFTFIPTMIRVTREGVD